MTIPHPPPKYLAYTLRCWEERGRDAPSEWRFMVLDAQTGERHGFGALRQLAAFLVEMMAQEKENKFDPEV